MPVKTAFIITVVGALLGVAGVIAGACIGITQIMVIGLVVLIIAAIFGLIFYRCPYCCRYLTNGLAYYCPCCGEQLIERKKRKEHLSKKKPKKQSDPLGILDELNDFTQSND